MEEDASSADSGPDTLLQLRYAVNEHFPARKDTHAPPPPSCYIFAHILK